MASLNQFPFLFNFNPTLSSKPKIIAFTINWSFLRSVYLFTIIKLKVKNGMIMMLNEIRMTAADSALPIFFLKYINKGLNIV